MSKYIGFYARVSTKRQDTKSQEPDLMRWEEGQEGLVKWYRDKFTGTTMDRPGWKRLEADIRLDKVSVRAPGGAKRSGQPQLSARVG